MLKLIAVLLCMQACTTRFYPTQTFQAKLVEVRKLDHGRAELLLRRAKDTTLIHFFYGNSTMTPRRFIVGDWYTIRYDSSQCRPCDSNRVVRASILHNY